MQLTFPQLVHEHHWLHDLTHLQHEKGWMLLRIYSARVLALAVTTSLWVRLTLATGVFTAAMVVLIGVAVGNAHHLLGNVPRRAHHSNALLMTVLGGMAANILAGLALFSSRMGVGYWEVLASRRIPEDLPMLLDAFVESFRLEDGFFYFLAAVLSMLSARCLRFFKIQKRKGAVRVF